MDWTTQDGHQEVVEPAPAQPTRHVHRLHLGSVVVAFILVITSLGLGVYVGHDMLKASSSAIKPVSTNLPFPFGNQGLGSQRRSRSSTSTPSSGSTSSTSAAVTKVADSVDQGLVDITTNLSYQGASAAGTGMILSADGLVLTNNHVIDGATSITARDVATNKVYKVKVVGYDVTQDVALLKLENASGLTTVTTGNATSLTVGQKVIGIGNAGGLGGTPSVASGKVVALDQTITAGDQGSAAGSEQLAGTIESNANIQPGDSGGPLVTTKGKSLEWIPPDPPGTKGSASARRPHSPRPTPFRSTRLSGSPSRSKPATPLPPCTSAQPRSSGSRPSQRQMPRRRDLRSARKAARVARSSCRSSRARPPHSRHWCPGT